MEHALSRLLTDVGHNAEALQTHLFRDLGDHLEAMRHDRAVGRVHRSDRLDMLLGDHEKMRRRLRVDVIEGIALLVLIDFFRGNFSRGDFTEQTILHIDRSFLLLPV